MAKPGSSRCASRNALAASAYWNRCSNSTPRRKDACASAECVDVGNAVDPSPATVCIGAGSTPLAWDGDVDSRAATSDATASRIRRDGMIVLRWEIPQYKACPVKENKNRVRCVPGALRGAWRERLVPYP